MAIDLDAIERGYREAMLRKYESQMKHFEDAFKDSAHNIGGMHISIRVDGQITLKPGVGRNPAHNITNQDAKHILNIIRMSIQDRIDKFKQDEEP